MPGGGAGRESVSLLGQVADGFEPAADASDVPSTEGKTKNTVERLDTNKRQLTWLSRGDNATQATSWRPVKLHRQDVARLFLYLDRASLASCVELVAVTFSYHVEPCISFSI